ncbi:hypothetical protein Pla123a_17930 [Posidoniimonas polymericola]|uniref:Uncharacterized protein n=1 Tax=Posidoniimonas polymericola TaxID=2528002 RepID=A0A5C5YSL0_9BACT|nr:hypothetical protein [Posidoniimonas polymericola]TWT77994.1 hypothetical protein Pla123a_17930 [Posidoniimonas polymericola]
MNRKNLVVAAVLASAFALGMLTSKQASAGKYGPAGLGANLHRRHVMKQATKNARRGLPVRKSAIVWLSAPQSNLRWAR